MECRDASRCYRDVLLIYESVKFLDFFQVFRAWTVLKKFLESVGESL